MNLWSPWGVVTDSAGSLYVADLEDSRVRKVSNGLIDAAAGNGVYGYSGDNGPALSAELAYPYGVAVDAAGNLYIADTNNSRIRKVSNGAISTVAGNGTAGYSGDNGPATSAQLNYPTAVAVDAAGDLYIADTQNNRIRKVSNGAIVTIAGNGTAGYSGDNGPAAAAQLNSPYGVALDSAGNLYIADRYNSRIRKVSNGAIVTVAGNGASGYSGDDGPATSAELSYPAGVAVDSAGDLYIADGGNSRIRRVSNGTIATIAGNGIAGFSGDNGPATSAELYEPLAVALDSAGNVYIADDGNNRIRVLTDPCASSLPARGGRLTGGIETRSSCPRPAGTPDLPPAH